MPEKKRIKRLLGHTDVIVKMVYDEIEGIIHTISLDRTLRTWELRTGKCKDVLILPHQHPKDMDYISIDKYILLTFEYGKVVAFCKMSREVKFTYYSPDEILGAFWY